MLKFTERPRCTLKDALSLLPRLPPVARAAVFGSLLSLGFVGLASREASAAEAANKCGCYQDSTGSCYCNKKATCGCPGACEPKGCEEKREKQMRKEIEAETRKAQSSARNTGSGSAKAGAAAESERGSESASSPSREKKAKVVHLTPSQRKELLHLLDLYAAERGGSSRTLDQVRDDLNSGAR